MFFSTKMKNIANLKHAFFSRKNGVSKGIYSSLNCGLGSKDNKKNITKNIAIVCKKLNLKKKNVITLNQIHSNKVICFHNKKEIKDKVTGDAIITKIKNVAIGILTADCVPILLYDPQKKIIGCAHAGWKGARSGIIENTINKLLKLDSNIKNLIVAIGPCINQQNYEVSLDFYKKFINQNKKNKQFFISSEKKKYFFNLRDYIHAKLLALGIENINHIKKDTFSDKKNFFSYRRSIKDKDRDYGRCISVIIMT